MRQKKKLNRHTIRFIYLFWYHEFYTNWSIIAEFRYLVYIRIQLSVEFNFVVLCSVDVLQGVIKGFVIHNYL